MKVVSESRVTWATSVQILVFLGLSVLELGPMYATDRQTDRQTDRRQMSDVRQKHRLMPPPYGGGITTAQNVPQADQPRAFDDDDLFSFMARNDFPQEQDLLLLNLIYIYIYI